MSTALTRRCFLTSSCALVVFATTPQLGVAQRLPRSLAPNRDLDTWLKIAPDGIVSVFTGKCELGQGIKTALAQIVADELDVSITHLRIETVDTAHSPNEGRTVGSNSIPDGGTALRIAAAEARAILLGNAARELGAAASSLTIRDGIVMAADGRSLSYGELLANGRFETRISGNPRLKDAERYRYVGRAEPRIDLPAKCLGEPSFIHDIVLPGMLHARVVRGDVPPGRILADDGLADIALPGGARVVRNGNFVAVVAEREEHAVAAADELRRHVRWQSDRSYPAQETFPSLLRTLPSDNTVIRDTSPQNPAVARSFEAEYSRPFIAHASLGPSAAVAEWNGDILTVYSHAQGMYPLRGALARVTGLSENRIRCIHADGAGCYGHNGADDAACDAALIALATEGTPVRLVWSRQAEFRHEPYGSAMSMRVAAGVDADGRIVDWRYELWSATHSTRPSGNATAGWLLAAREKSDPLPTPPISDIGQPAGGADRNAVPLYTIPSQLVVEHLVHERTLRTSALRSLGAHGNVFAIESFIDEIARSVDADPIEFRLKHLDDPRARAVIELALEIAQRASGNDRHSPAGVSGRGIGFAKYKNLSSYLAVIADVDVNLDTGAIRLVRAFAAMDAGQIVNPDGIRNQIEGGIVQSASWALKEQVSFSNDRVVSTDWISYPILTFDEAPDIDIELIDRPELPFVGAGEAAQGPTTAAIANAVADAAGLRLRHLPLTPEKVRVAIAAARSAASQTGNV